MIKPQVYVAGMDLTPWFDWDDFAKNDLTHSQIRYTRLHDRYAEEITSTERRPTRNPTIGGLTHGWLRQAFDGSEVVRENASQVKIPVLIFQAGQDTAVRGPEQVSSTGGRSAYPCAAAFFRATSRWE